MPRQLCASLILKKKLDWKSRTIVSFWCVVVNFFNIHNFLSSGTFLSVNIPISCYFCWLHWLRWEERIVRLNLFFCRKCSFLRWLLTSFERTWESVKSPFFKKSVVLIVSTCHHKLSLIYDLKNYCSLEMYIVHLSIITVVKITKIGYKLFADWLLYKGKKFCIINLRWGNLYAGKYSSFECLTSIFPGNFGSSFRIYYLSSVYFYI